MQSGNAFSIKGNINFLFRNSNHRDIAYNSYFPELKKLQTKRSKLSMKKENEKKLLFLIICSDITAFRATINDVIALGKIVENCIKIFDTS